MIVNSRIYRTAKLDRVKDDSAVSLGSMGWHEAMESGVLRYESGLPHWMLMFFESGGIELGFEAACTIEQPGWYFWSPGMPQRYGCNRQAWSHSWLHIEGALVGDWIQAVGLETGRFYPDPQGSAVVNVYFRRFFNERSLYSEPHQGVLAAQFQSMLFEIERGIFRTSKFAVAPGVERAKLFLDRSLDRSVPLAELAREADLSIPHLCALFKQRFGRSPGRYHMQARMELASFYLVKRGLSVGHVADRLGYPDVYSFSRMYKRVKGVAPSRAKEAY